MKVIGYSERGILNSLFYEIARCPDPPATLHSFLDRVTFPFTLAKPLLGQSEVMIEQSFSQFGVSDAVATIRDQHERTCSLFIEAKVKTFHAGDRSIRCEFNEFCNGLSHKVSSSNLFTQLYHKVRLVRALKEGGIQQLRQGVSFPSWSSRAIRKIGTNGVVLDATRRVFTHLGDVFYCVIVPDTLERVAAFFPGLKTTPHPTLADTWDVANFGYITWSQVRAFCLEANLVRVVEIFDFNSGQLYLV